MLLGFFALVSRAIGLVRDKYIAYTFGAGHQTDAYNIAFNLPDWVNYLLVGGAASISFVTILSRYREQGRDEDGEVALSVILNTMALVLGSALLLAEFFIAPWYIRLYSSGDPAQDALALYMTRILLPGQLFFFAGGVLASVALVRKQFSYQAISPLVYTMGIILGGLLGAHWLGIPSLAWGALAGSVAGPFLVNAYAVRRSGGRWRPVLDFHNEGLRDWVKMSLPMMLGVTVVFMDSQILQYFAKHATGDISRMMNAKKLFTAPMAIIGQAAGAASLPFFASLYSRGMYEDFRNAVNRSVTRIISIALLLTSAMFAMARPLCDLVLRGGHYTHADSLQTAMFLAVFSLSLALWSSQAIYIRAFYAAEQTLPPMVAGTIITLVSLPMYWSLYAHFGVIGLAWASNLAILAHTVTLAVLLHKRYLVSLDGLDYKEILRSLGAASISGAGVFVLLQIAPARSGYIWDIALLTAGCCAWAALGFVALHLTGSALPAQILRRRKS
ncbi:murein biosynthesis integral membrane protein MurJ [Granulicella mallensis]|nr:murein biosynthesis integral membrane protein MurJ [Granulicella mallensis]